MLKIKLTRRAVLLSLFGILLTATSPGRERELPSGILVQTYVHDRWVVNPFTGQVGGTFPFQASLRVYSVRSGRLVTTVMTDLAGHARISLRPGDYELVPDTMQHGQVTDADIIIGRFEAASPTIVRVRGHRFVPSTITYEENMGN